MQKRYALLIVMTVFSSFAHAEEIFTTTTSYIPPMDCMLWIRTSPQQGGTTDPWPGEHFIQGCSPETIEAIPNTGFEFSHWERNDGSFISYENPITIEFTSLSIVAVFDTLGDFPNIHLIGEYTCSENPFGLRHLCSPAVWSLIDDNNIYYLTKNWEWLWGCESISLDGYIPKEGDLVIVEGEVSEATNYHDNSPYSNIEVENLLPIAMPSSTTTQPTTSSTVLAECIINIEISPPESGTTSPPPPQCFVQGCFPQKVWAIRPSPGYVFSHWEDEEGSLLGYNNPIAIDFKDSGMPTVVAVYIPWEGCATIPTTVTTTVNSTTSTTSDSSTTPTSTPIITTTTIPRTYSISGTVRGDVKANITINLTGAALQNTITNQEGQYTFTVWEGGYYKITPDNVNYDFDPANCVVQNLTSNLTSIDFVATEYNPMPCAAEAIYGEDSAQVEILRLVRDNVLSRTPEGRELIKLYYLWSPAIFQAMEGNEEFEEWVRESIEDVLARIEMPQK